jgi:hypothetical protein
MTRYNDEYIIGTAAGLYRSASLAKNSQVAITDSGVLDGTKLAFVQGPPTAFKQTEASEINDYLFIAGGGALRKLSPTWALTEWGIAPPDVSSMTAVAVAEGITNSKVINACDATTGWAWTRMNGTGTDATLSLDTTRKVENTGSLRIAAILKDTEGYIEKTEAFNLELFDDAATASTEDDYITFFVRINRPKHIKSIEVAFSVGDANFNHAYIYEMAVEKVKRKNKKRELIGTGDLIKPADELSFLTENKAVHRDFSTSEFLADNVLGVARRRWTSVTIPKNKFAKSGGAGTTGKTWAEVAAIRLTIATNKKGKVAVNFDGIKMVGGTGMQGDYQYNITYLNSTTGTRSNPDLTNTVNVENVNRTGVTLDDIPLSTDTQVDKIEIWRTLGNGALLFKCKEIDNTEWGADEGDQRTVDNVADYIGLKEGATEFLEDLELPVNNIKPEDTYEDCTGPHAGRIWWSRDSAIGKGGRIYYSPVGRFEAVAGFIDVSGNDDEIQKIVVWDGRLWAFTISHVFEVFNFDEPFVAREVVGAPGTSQPHTVVSTEGGIIYRAKDGVRVFPGASGRSDLLGELDPLAPIWRNSTTDGFSVAFTGDHAAYGRGEYYIADSTSASSTTLACDVSTGAWRDIGFPCRFLFFDPEGNRLFGTEESGVIGGVWYSREADSSPSFAVGTATQYVAIGVASSPAIGQASVLEAQMMMPKAATLTSIRMQVAAAVGNSSDDTFSINVNVNGSKVTTDDNGATFTCTIGYDDGANASASATGSIALAQDDLVCWEATFTGDVASVAVRQIVATYTVAP